MLRNRPPGGIPPRLPVGSYGPSLAARGLALSRTMRNLPTVAIGLGLLLAAVLLDQRTAGDRKVVKRAPNWAPSSWPPRSGDPPPEWWPTGEIGKYNAKSYAEFKVTGRVWRWELDYDTGELYKNITYTGPLGNTLLVGPGVVISAETDTDPPEPFVTSRTIFYNTNENGTKVAIMELIDNWGDVIDNVKTTLKAPDWAPIKEPYPPFPAPQPLPFPGPRPVPEPLPLPAQPVPRLPVPMAPPRVAPGDPLVLPEPPQDPVVAPRPLRRAAPSPGPLRWPGPVLSPARLLVSRNLLPSGRPVPLLPLPVPVTQPWLEVPWPGGPAIGSPAQQPPATPQGIAKELGRLESKVAAIGGKSGLDLERIVELIRSLLPEAPEYRYPAGRYLLYPVCEYDEQGRPLPPREATWNAGTGEMAELRQRVDAIANLLQFHKELRQPVCRGLPPVGQPVTVTFEQEEVS